MEENDRKWREVSFFNGRIAMPIPEEWEKPSPDVLERKFPYSIKPQETYGSGDGRQLFTFSLLGQELGEGEVQDAVQEVQRLIWRMYPESIEKASQMVQTGAGTAGWFYYMTGGMEEEQGHILFVLSLDGHMVLGGFHFPAREKQAGEDLLLEMLGQLEIVEEQETPQEKGTAFYARNRIQ